MDKFIESFDSSPEELILQTKEKQRLFGQITYGAKTWTRKRRVIVKAEHGAKGANPRFVVTNIIKKTGRIGFQMSTSYPFQDLFRTVAARLRPA